MGIQSMDLKEEKFQLKHFQQMQQISNFMELVCTLEQQKEN